MMAGHQLALIRILHYIELQEIHMKTIENLLEVLIFNSRWLLAPFYLGLVGGIVMLLVKFTQELFHVLPNIFSSTETEVVLAVLALVDLSLVANLLLIVVFSGYENFVSKINTKGHEDRPEWMGQVDFASLKIKVIASIVAISAIELLKSFVNLSILLKTGGDTPAIWSEADQAIAWKVGIHVVLVITGLLFAYMDNISERTHALKHKGNFEQ
jgi:uncharacterized protein (TIGR00645 family)